MKYSQYNRNIRWHHPLKPISSAQVIVLQLFNKEVVMLNKNMLLIGTVLMSVSVMAPAHAGSDANKMSDEITAQYEEAKEFTFEQKEDFLAWVDTKTDQLGEQYEDVSVQVKDDSEEAVEELAEAWDSVSDELSEALENAKDASADTWEDVKANTVNALENAQKAISDGQGAE
jgi:gas vesicle protein